MLEQDTYSNVIAYTDKFNDFAYYWVCHKSLEFLSCSWMNDWVQSHFFARGDWLAVQGLCVSGDFYVGPVGSMFHIKSMPCNHFRVKIHWMMDVFWVFCRSRRLYDLCSCVRRKLDAILLTSKMQFDPTEILWKLN